MKLGGFDFSKISLKDKIKLQVVFYAITFVILFLIYNKSIADPKNALQQEVQKSRESFTAVTITLSNSQQKLNELQSKVTGKFVSKQSSSDIASLIKNKDLSASLSNISGIIASRSGNIISLQTSLPEVRGTFKIVRVKFEFTMNYRDFVLFMKDLNEKEKLTHIRIARYELPETPEKRGQALLEIEIYGAI